MELSVFGSALHSVSQALLVPVIVVLFLMIAITTLMLGSLVAEYFTERRRMRAKIPDLIDTLQGKTGEALTREINHSGLLKRQKRALVVLAEHEVLPAPSREALARRLLFEEQLHYSKILRVTDLIARLGPMFGLMGTLIPLGPGLIALGQGDTLTLAGSLLTAFDTTVAGLISGAVSYFVSNIRHKWYDNYDTALETIMECMLDPDHRLEVSFKAPAVQNVPMKGGRQDERQIKRQPPISTPTKGRS